MHAKLAALTAALMFFTTVAGAAAAQGGNVEIQKPWARATPGGAQTAAIYVTLTSEAGDKLIAASTPAAQKAELHQMTMDGNVMKMRQVDAVDLPQGQAVALKPGGYHIMLTGLTEPLKEGQSIQLTLTFAEAGTRYVTVPVLGVGAAGPAGTSDSSTSMPGMSMPMHH
jgi:periplasmic copper chaperone A